MKKLDVLAAALLIVGGLNWGLVALAEFDLVATLVGLDFGETNAASRLCTASSVSPPSTRSPSRPRSAAAGLAPSPPKQEKERRR